MGAEAGRRDGRMETGDTVTRRYRPCHRDREGPHRGHGLGVSRFPQAPAPPPDYDERSHLHDSFTQMIQSLQELATAQGEWGGDGSSGRRGLGARKRWRVYREGLGV